MPFIRHTFGKNLNSNTNRSMGLLSDHHFNKNTNHKSGIESSAQAVFNDSDITPDDGFRIVFNDVGATPETGALMLFNGD